MGCRFWFYKGVNMAWYLYWILGLVWFPCYVWLTRFFYATNREKLSSVFVYTISIPLALPACFVILLTGTIFAALDWAAGFYDRK